MSGIGGAGMLSYPRVFISAGEHSGDRFGSALAQALRERWPDARLVGVGGPRMAAEGVRLAADTVGHAGMGMLRAARNLTAWVRVYRACVREFNRERPDVLVPIDNPGFNLRLARLARARDIPVCYYVSPQVWAWFPWRMRRIGRVVTRMMTILPFEKVMYDRIGTDCRYVGHPLLDYLAASRLDEGFIRRMQTGPQPVVGLLPGSREQEIEQTFPIICNAAALISRELPGAVFEVAAAAREHVSRLREIVRARNVPAQVRLGATAEIMKGARVCLVVSGTATLETAWFRTPMVIVYRAPRAARYAARMFLNVRHIGLVNIIAGKEAAPEFLKFDDDARPIAAAALRLLGDETEWRRCRAELNAVIESLGPAGASARAAQAVMECVGQAPAQV